jgi:hypothetical protein
MLDVGHIFKIWYKQSIIFLQKLVHGPQLSDGTNPSTNNLLRSLWLGILALVNGILFIAIGTAIQYFNSEGALSAPIVRSIANESCLNAEKYHFIKSSFQ